MKSRDWKEIAELIGIAAIVASLIFVGLQMKQAQDIAQAERRSLVASNEIEVANVITANAEIWVKGLAGEELDNAEFAVFEKLVIMKADFHFLTARAAQTLDHRPGWEGHILQLAKLLHASPSAREVWISDLELDRKINSLIFPTSGKFIGPFGDEVLSALAKLGDAEL